MNLKKKYQLLDKLWNNDDEYNKAGEHSLDGCMGRFGGRLSRPDDGGSICEGKRVGSA